MSATPQPRKSAVPPYRKVAAELARKIHAGVYDSGLPFPSESALKDRFGRAPMTIRRALEVVRDEMGLIETDWGKGSTVRPPETRPAPPVE
ncbi:GntR family transcriptional regulator [Kitasatospora phosalacinea]|uniref:HTH gntR-type domain-containing protein n=1 Tax=Kitasatospora phosalacinea TaxID=2065 RepID=A0A9W6PF68_9ACTN|nr:GntR family transcriptional regulator [Kitasatospora phosalacinea]GLW53991.1 hypothetical protein Kpho01_20020 [Kitasatospora phosalacinea]